MPNGDVEPWTNHTRGMKQVRSHLSSQRRSKARLKKALCARGTKVLDDLECPKLGHHTHKSLDLLIYMPLQVETSKPQINEHAP